VVAAMRRFEPSPCWDCGVDTTAVGENFFVNNEVWAEADMDPLIDVDAEFTAMWRLDPPKLKREVYGGYFLCVGCLETRLGRALKPDDFQKIIYNDPRLRNTSARLRSRVVGVECRSVDDIPAEVWQEWEIKRVAHDQYTKAWQQEWDALVLERHRKRGWGHGTS
jgi:hypothetical protein